MSEKIIIAAISACLGAGAATAWFQSGGYIGGYQECMVAEMRGQVATMTRTVSEMCIKRHPLE